MFCDNNNSKNCLEKSLREVKLEPGPHEYAWSPKDAALACVQPVPNVSDAAEEEERRGEEDTKIGV